MKQNLINFLELVKTGNKTDARQMLDSNYINQDDSFIEKWNNFNVTEFSVQDFAVTKKGGVIETIPEKYRVTINGKSKAVFVKLGKIIPTFI